MKDELLEMILEELKLLTTEEREELLELWKNK